MVNPDHLKTKRSLEIKRVPDEIALKNSKNLSGSRRQPNIAVARLYSHIRNIEQHETFSQPAPRVSGVRAPRGPEPLTIFVVVLLIVMHCALPMNN